MADSEDKRARRMGRARRLQGWVDPAGAQHVTSLPDVAGPAAGIRAVERENASLRLLEQLLIEQRETNALLRLLLERD